MLSLIDGETLRYSFGVGWVGIFPARVEFFKRDQIRPVPVHLVCGNMDERRLGTELADRFQDVKCAEGIDFEIEERNRGSGIMGGLRGGMDDEVRARLLHDAKHSLAIANVYGFMLVIGDFMAKTLEDPTCIAFSAKEYSPVIAVDPDHAESLASKENRHFGTDEAAGAGH
jgi:hypothetical protein